jgi:hypothetical protein
MDDNWYASKVDREIAARPEMARAVVTPPCDRWFHSDARGLLVQSLERGKYQDDLLVVLQRVRISIERYAVHIGLPIPDLGETRDPRPHTERRGHFEHDVVHDYLPAYLTGTDRQDINICFKLHARSAYRDALRQHVRRGRHRAALWHLALPDARTHQELAVETSEDDETVVVGATHFAQWVPTPAEVHDATSMCNELRRLLEPFDYRVAELLMSNAIVQGDKRELARLLDVNQGAISRAVRKIEDALHVIYRRRQG